MNDMWRSEAWTILGELWDNANEHQRKALRIAQNDIEFVDLMPDDMVAVVRCKDCVNGELCLNSQGAEYVVCSMDEHHVWLPNGFCSYGERKDGDG